MLCGKLPDGSIVKDSAARQHIVSVPGQPVKDVFLLEHGGHFSVRACKVIQGLRVASAPVAGKVPEPVFTFPFNEIINRRFEFSVPSLFEITKDVRGSDQIRRASDSNCRSVRKTNYRQTPFSRNTLAVKDLGHKGASH